MDALDPNTVGSMDPAGDPEASLYTCPLCGLERPAHEYLAQDAQSYTPYCSACMAGYVEAMPLHAHEDDAAAAQI